MGGPKTGYLVLPLAFWVSQDVGVAEYVRSCQTCQRTKAERGGQRRLLHPLPLPLRRGGMIGMDWIARLPTTVAGFDVIQNHVDLLSGKVHAVQTPSTAPVKDAAAIIFAICACGPAPDRRHISPYTLACHARCAAARRGTSIKPFFARAGTPLVPGPVSNAVQE